jgi:hypothetical protein
MFIDYQSVRIDIESITYGEVIAQTMCSPRLMLFSRIGNTEGFVGDVSTAVSILPAQ